MPFNFGWRGRASRAAQPDRSAARVRWGSIMSQWCCSRWLSLLLTVSLSGCQPNPTTVASPMSDGQPPARADSFLGSRGGEEREVADIKLCWCPAGRFMMGSPPDEPERRPGEDQVEVTLTKGFWMGKYEVTQEIGRAHV